MSLISEHWILNASEIHVLLSAEVTEKYEKYPPEWYTGTFSGEQRSIIQNVLKNALKIQNKDDKEVTEYINKQEVWLREAFIVMIEEEIKFMRMRTRN